MTVAVVGGGASGMMAALSAAENGAQVLLFERQNRVGRKLLATGNGRCNLTNLSALQGHYHGDCPAFSECALTSFSVKDTLQYFESLGLVSTAEASGRVYPYSDQANSVVDILRFALDAPNIQVETGQEVQKIRRTPQGFLLVLPEGPVACDRVIVACGGVAGSKLGGTMSGYQLLRGLGHKCTRLRPSLVQILSSYPRLPSLKGIRAQCRAEIYKDRVVFAAGGGEIQFTEHGISGPVIFDLSRDVCAQSGTWTCRLDLVPQFTHQQLTERLFQKQARFPSLTAGDLFTGLLHNRLGRVLIQESGLSPNGSLASLSSGQIQQAAQCAKGLTLDLTGPLGMDSAQVTAGGIRTDEFDPRTLESRLVPGLYACGEVLDVDGDCGGYNLQWAWSSGRIAGLSAGKEAL